MSIPAKLFDLLAGLPDPLPPEPIPLLVAWFDEAMRAKHVPNPNAMILATVGGGGGPGSDSSPSARVILCKSIEPDTGSLVFFTNYDSRKGGELAANPRAACVFHWDHAERQARIEGRVERTTDAESDAYFASRPLLSRIGAWSSRQSRPLERRADLLKQVEETLARFGLTWAEVVLGKTNKPLPRPENWGGFRLRADRVELWQGVAGRLHDRGVWTREPVAAAWNSHRLQP